MADEHKSGPQPPHSGANRVRIGEIDLEKDLLDWIDARAERQGVTRNAVIESALRHYRDSRRPQRKGTNWN